MPRRAALSQGGLVQGGLVVRGGLIGGPPRTRPAAFGCARRIWSWSDADLAPKRDQFTGSRPNRGDAGPAGRSRARRAPPRGEGRRERPRLAPPRPRLAPPRPRLAPPRPRLAPPRPRLAPPRPRLAPPRPRLAPPRPRLAPPRPRRAPFGCARRIWSWSDADLAPKRDQFTRSRPNRGDAGPAGRPQGPKGAAKGRRAPAKTPKGAAKAPKGAAKASKGAGQGPDWRRQGLEGRLLGALGAFGRGLMQILPRSATNSPDRAQIRGIGARRAPPGREGCR